jgi:hypothetical protein
MEKLVEWLAGEIEVLGENLPQCRFVHHKPYMPARTWNPGRRGEKPASNRLRTPEVKTVYIYILSLDQF